LAEGPGFYSPARRIFTERTEEIGTRKNTDERGFCWSRMVGEWMARAFAAVRGQQKLVPSTRVFPCPKSLCFLGALCAAAVCFSLVVAMPLQEIRGLFFYFRNRPGSVAAAEELVRNAG